MREEREQEHKNYFEKVRKEAKASAEHIVTERGRAFSRYHGVLRSIQTTFKTVSEPNAGYFERLVQV